MLEPASMDIMEEDPMTTTPPIPHHEDIDTSMTITEEERTWALRIRQAVQDTEEIANISDFECAQYAIVTRGNVKDALQRAYGTQVFRQEYGIHHSVEQAVSAYQEHFHQQPGYILNMDVDEETDEVIGVLDLGQFRPQKTLTYSKNDRNWKLDVTRCYYQNILATTSLNSIRQGVFLIIDCDNIGWDNFSVEYATRLHSELWGCQAVRFKNLLCYNTGSVANVCWNMIKHLMDANMRESLQLGCQLVDGSQQMDAAQTPQRLSELYLQPTMEDAQEKMLDRIAELIELRTHNEAKFRL